MIPDTCPRKTRIGSCSEIAMYHPECCDKDGNLSCLSIGLFEQIKKLPAETIAKIK